MQPFSRIEGIAVPLARANVDTDAIIPQRWLVTISRTGLGRGLFGAWRYDDAGNERDDFVLNRPVYRGARILVAGANYGCGSSREHAVWAHLDHGIGAVIAPSYGPIFYDNCFKNGLLPVTLPAATVDELLRQLAAQPGITMAVDLRNCRVTTPDGIVHAFTLDAARRQALLDGIDEIAATLAHERAIAAFQAADLVRRPWVWERTPAIEEEEQQ